MTRCSVVASSRGRRATAASAALAAVWVMLLTLMLLSVSVLASAQPSSAVQTDVAPLGFGPLTPEQCWQINPTWRNDTCTSLYGEPAVNYYAQLPWNDVPAYTACVQQRCVCTHIRANTSFQPNELYCGGPPNSFTESGFVTCNNMVDCYAVFWRCTTDALMQRYLTKQTLTPAEERAVAEIIAHGNTPGQSFQESGMYNSCRFLTCQAASSRPSCGLQTCLPNYTQCYEYIRPPPLPFHHQLCTQGCRAGLLLMALTIASVCFALCCCACCPPRVRAVDPTFGKDGKSSSGSDKQVPVSP